MESSASAEVERWTRVGRTRQSAERLAGRVLAGGAAIAAEFSVAAAAVTPREPISLDIFASLHVVISTPGVLFLLLLLL